MDCTLIAGELIAYHFGTCSDSSRLEIESHLLACKDCLRAYLTLKRELEAGTGSARPSPALRERLRADVARTFGVDARRRARWFDRRIPLYQSIAAAAVAALIALVLPKLIDDLHADSRSRSSTVIDTSRSLPQSATLY